MARQNHSSLLKKFALASTLALAAGFNAYAADAANDKDKDKAPNWTEFTTRAQKGEFYSANIFGNTVTGYKRAGEGEKPVTVDVRGPSQEIAYTELKRNIADISFNPPSQESAKPVPPPEKTFGEKMGAIGMSFLGFLKDLLPIFLLIGAMVGVMLYSVRIQKGAMNKGVKNAFKPIAAKDNLVRFADVAGCDGAKFEVQEVVDILKDPDKFSKNGAKCPRGVLLVGGPGTGKTLLAQAVAGEAEVPFFQMSGSTFVEMFVGVGASRVRELFAAAKKHKKAIIFIDEIDAIGKIRGNGLGNSDSEREQTLNQILVEMQGFDQSHQIIVFAATNRPEILDPALTRPGRFDRQVMVENADVAGREEILKVHVKDKPVATDISLRDIARGTPGFSGADLANIVNEAAIFSGRRGGDDISKEDFRNAIDKVRLGIAGKVTDDPEQKALLAYHEAAHVLGLLHEPFAPPFDKVTIVPRGRTGGHASWLPRESGLQGTVGEMDAQIRVAVAGRVGERLIFGDSKITAGAQGDIQFATDMARRMIADLGMSKEMGMVKYRENAEDPDTLKKITDLVRLKIDEAEKYMTEVITKNIEPLHTIAQELMEKETLDAAQINQLVKVERIPDPHTLVPGYNAGLGMRLPKAMGMRA